MLNNNSATTKNNIWEHILKSINFNFEADIQYITANQIKDAKKTWNGKDNQFEPRLLCKMDSLKDVPDCFKKNNISIISVQNGKYAIIKNNIYIQLPSQNIDAKKIKNNNDSMILSIGNSETSMLDKLLYNGIFEEIIGEKILYGPLLGGRHRCTFETQIGEQKLNIKGCQYETDGCYETNKFICLVEAKTGEYNDFNIRQLYFPYREIYKKTKNRKEIIPLFICKDKQNVIHIFKFKWNDYRKMLDVKCTDYYKYI